MRAAALNVPSAHPGRQGQCLCRQHVCQHVMQHHTQFTSMMQALSLSVNVKFNKHRCRWERLGGACTSALCKARQPATLGVYAAVLTETTPGSFLSVCHHRAQKRSREAAAVQRGQRGTRRHTPSFWQNSSGLGVTVITALSIAAGGSHEAPPAQLQARRAA